MINLLKKETAITLITLIIVIILALILILSFRFINSKRNNNFVKTTATIINSKYHSSSDTSTHYYKYIYTVNGKEYTGSFSDGLFYNYKINDEITIKYEKDNPHISKRVDNKSFIISFFIMLAIGLVVKYFSDRMSLF